ncbi:MAG: hypothetical protein AB1749_08895 [Pseudomonadota bacterium]
MELASSTAWTDVSGGSRVTVILPHAVRVCESKWVASLAVAFLLSLAALLAPASLALNQPSADDATPSVKIFVVAYATISVMIALLIFEVNERPSRSRRMMRLMHVMRTYLVPVAATAFIGCVLISASSEDAVLEVLHATWKRVAASATRGSSPSRHAAACKLATKARTISARAWRGCAAGCGGAC